MVVKIRVPFLGTLNERCRTVIGTQKGTIILTTTHKEPRQRVYFGFRITASGLGLVAKRGVGQADDQSFTL